MKILVFGLGSIGQKFCKLIDKNFGYDLFALRSPKKYDHNRNEYFCLMPTERNLFSWGEVDNIKPDVAIITNPTYRHIDTAIQCAERGMHLFITKPLDCRLDDSLTRLKELISAQRLTSYLAYPLRHLPIAKKLKSENRHHIVMQFACHTDLSKWRNYKTYSSEYSKGGGALLELSHELDLATYILGDVLRISGYTFNLRDTETDAEDMANVTLFHKNGNTSFHSLNLMSDVEERYIQLGEDRYNIIPDDKMYLDMLGYFFENVGNFEIMNNIFEASRLYEVLWEFRDATHRDNMCKGR